MFPNPDGRALEGCPKRQEVVLDEGLQTAAGIVHAVYQPASHFWALQTRETALFTLLAVLLIGFTAWWTHERSP